MRLIIGSAVALILLAPSISMAQESLSSTRGYVNFDVPGAVGSAPAGSYDVGTIVQDMNNRGDIIGYYTSDSSVKTRGFLRKRDGEIIFIDDPRAGVPEADTTPTVAVTTPLAIDDRGTIVGYSIDPVGIEEAFVRRNKGEFQNYQASTPNGLAYSTQALSINARGEIAGRYGVGGPSYAYVREPDGSFQSFQAPDASMNGFLAGTVVLSVNDLGASTGYYYDSNYDAHSFVRQSDGTIAEFAVPGSGTNPYQGAWPIRIYNSGVVLGFYVDNNWNEHSYVRLTNGQVLTFQVPPGVSWKNIFVSDLGANGEIAGTYLDGNSVEHAFVRTLDGHIADFTDPAAGSGAYQGTIPVRINAKGEVAGYFIDAGNLYHGFIWMPKLQR